MKIAIAGAGAMGGRFGYMLKKSGQEVILGKSMLTTLTKMVLLLIMTEQRKLYLLRHIHLRK